MPALGSRINLIDRLWRFIEPEPNSGCWLWAGGFDNRGRPFKPYGRIWVEGKTLNAHRVSWELINGQIPDGMIICHKCDTPLCVNPSHLFLGTAKENTQDMISKGRDYSTRASRRGESSNFNKLSSEQVLAIYKDTRTQSAIAKDYGITQSAVSRIKLKKVWAHIWDISTKEMEHLGIT